jgi:hypothetical protein
VTKVHVDDFISCHAVSCNKLAIYWFVAKLCAIINVAHNLGTWALKPNVNWMYSSKTEMITSAMPNDSSTQ